MNRFCRNFVLSVSISSCSTEALYHQTVAFLGDQRRYGILNVSKKLLQTKALDVELHLARLDLGEIENVVDERQEMASRAHYLIQIRNESSLPKIAGILDEHFAITDDRIQRRAQLVAHGSEETALFFAGDLSATPCLLQFLLPVLQIRYVGIDRDGPALRRLSLGDAQPCSIGELPLDHALRLAVTPHGLSDPALYSAASDIGRAAFCLRTNDIFEGSPGRHEIRSLRKQLKIALVDQNQPVVGVEEREPVGNGLDRRHHRIALALGNRFKLATLRLAVAQQSQRL